MHRLKQYKMVQAKKFILSKRLDGMPKIDDFVLEEETLPDVDDGGILFFTLNFRLNKVF